MWSIKREVRIWKAIILGLMRALPSPPSTGQLQKAEPLRF